MRIHWRPITWAEQPPKFQSIPKLLDGCQPMLKFYLFSLSTWLQPVASWVEAAGPSMGGIIKTRPLVHRILGYDAVVVTCVRRMSQCPVTPSFSTFRKMIYFHNLHINDARIHNLSFDMLMIGRRAGLVAHTVANWRVIKTYPTHQYFWLWFKIFLIQS